MNIPYQEIARRIFSIVVGSSRTVFIFDDKGKKIYDPEQARRFFIEPEKMMVSIATAGERSSIQVYFNEGTNINDIKRLLADLRKTATHYMLSFTVRKFAKVLSPKDFAYQAEIKKDIEEGSNGMKENVQERMEGSTRSSYQDIGNARLIIRHSAKVDENVIGARARNIRCIFVENKDGERFKMPSNNLMAARAMARHISSGGVFHDDTAVKINEMVTEWRDLSKLSRHIRENSNRIDEETYMVTRDAAERRVDEISATLRKLTLQRGYQTVAPQLLGETNDISEEIMAEEVSRLREILVLEDEDFSTGLRSLARHTIAARQPLEEARAAADPNAPPKPRDQQKHQDDLKAALAQLMVNKGTAVLDFSPELVRFGSRGGVGSRGGDAGRDNEQPPHFIDAYAEIRTKLGALAAAVKNDSLSIVLGKIHEKLTDGKKLTDGEKRLMVRALAVAGRIDPRLRIVSLQSTAPTAESIDFEEIGSLTEWSNQFLPERILRETYRPTQFRRNLLRFAPGDTVSVMPTPAMNRTTYPHANWIAERTNVRLRDATVKGGVDLVEVELPDGETAKLYGFNIVNQISETSDLGQDEIWEIAADMVRWQKHPAKLREVSKNINEADLMAVLKCIDMVWQPGVSDSIRDSLFEDAVPVENVAADEDEIANAIDDDAPASDEGSGTKLDFEEVGDVMSAEQRLQDEGFSFVTDLDTNRLVFDSREDAKRASQILEKEGMPHDLTESFDVIGGSAENDFISDISRARRQDFSDSKPTIHNSQEFLEVNDETSLREAMRLLDEEGIDYTSYAPNRFEFRDASSLKRAKLVLESGAIPITLVTTKESQENGVSSTDYMGSMRDKILALM